MKTKMTALLLVIGILFSTSASASFPSSCNPCTMISDLSDDIGTMADRILDMADEIGEMADKIGEMADRIVHTEEMMADLTRDLAAQNSTANATTVIISNESQDVLSENDVPSFTINSNTQEMLIYVSSSLTMDTNTISVLVNTNQTLDQKWNELKSLAQNGKIFLAVKTIDQNNISSLSNVLTYSTLY